MRARTIVILVVSLLLLVILLQNTQVVTLKIFFWEVSMSQVILIPLVLLVGFVTGAVVGRLWSRKSLPFARADDDL